jgi:hypothetical protein
VRICFAEICFQNMHFLCVDIGEEGMNIKRMDIERMNIIKG